MLSVRFKDDVYRNTNRDQRLCDMFAKVVFADQYGFLRRCQILVIAGGQDGHGVRVPRNDFSFGWVYTANKFVSRQGTGQHVDG